MFSQIFTLLLVSRVYAFSGGHLVENTDTNCQKLHTVVAGDTCDKLWKMYQLLGIQSLMDTNSNLDCNRLFINQNVCVDGSKENLRCAEKYKIQDGDSCWSVASQFNISVANLTEMNQHVACDAADYIYVGQVVCVSEAGLNSTNATTTSSSSTAIETSTAAPEQQPTQTPQPQARVASVDSAPSPNLDILAAHNQARAEHGVGALSWSSGLASEAQGYANVLASRGCALQHSRGGDEGENLYSSSAAGSMTNALTAWYNEKYSWSFGSRVLNHYTQVMWSGTRNVGCASSSGSGGCQVVVCRYSPAGNVMGRNPW